MSLLASPVVSLLYGVVNQGPGDLGVRAMLWSQAFIVLTAVSLAWSVNGVITLQKIIATAATADAAAVAAADPIGAVAVDDGVVTNNGDERTSSNSNGANGIIDEIEDQRGQNICSRVVQAQGQEAQTQAQAQAAAAAAPAKTLLSSPETCIIKAAEAILSGRPGSIADEDAALATLKTTVRQVRLHGLTVDTPVLQTANALHAWSNVISHQGEVERDIRETDRWGVFEQKLISMNAGMPFMVGIIQVHTPCVCTPYMKGYDTKRCVVVIGLYVSV